MRSHTTFLNSYALEHEGLYHAYSAAGGLRVADIPFTGLMDFRPQFPDNSLREPPVETQ